MAILQDYYQIAGIFINDFNDTECKVRELSCALQQWQQIGEALTNAEYNNDLVSICDEIFDQMGTDRYEKVFVGPNNKTYGINFIRVHATQQVLIHQFTLCEHVIIIESEDGRLDKVTADHNVVYSRLDNIKKSWNYYNLSFTPRVSSLPTKIGEITNYLKTTLQVSGLYSALCQFVKGKIHSASDFATLVQSNFRDLTSKANQVYREILSTNAFRSPGHAIETLKTLYSRMSKVETDENDELVFNTNDYSVIFCWNTVIEVASSLISTAVQIIGTVLRNVVGAVVMAVGTIISAGINIFKTAVSPTLSVDDDALCSGLTIPIGQIAKAADYVEEVPFCAQLGQGNFETPISITKFWIDEDSGSKCYETYLKPVISIDGWINSGIHDYHTYPQAFDIPPIVGFSDIFSIMNSLNTSHPDYINPVAIEAVNAESMQSLWILLNLLGYVSALSINTPSTHYTQDHTFVASDWNAFTNVDASLGGGYYMPLFRAAFYYCYSYVKHFGQTGYPKQVGGLSAADDEAMRQLGFNWETICNKVVPALIALKIGMTDKIDGNYYFIRDLNTIVSDHGVGLSSELASSLAISGLTISTDIITERDMRYRTPRYSATGILFVLTGIAVIAAAVTVAAVVGSIKWKKFATNQQLKRSQKCINSKKAYDAALNGIDVNDPEGKTPHEYTKEEQKQFYNDYYKSVKSYNRWSVLWGGSTWSTVNGWDDGKPDIASEANADVPIDDVLNDQVFPQMAINDGETSYDDISLNTIYHSIVG